MILIFNDSLLFHQLWECDRKRLSNSTIYGWYTHYMEHIMGYYINRDLQTYLGDQFILIHSNDEFDRSKALNNLFVSDMPCIMKIGIDLYLGKDIVILKGKPFDHSDESLEIILDLVKAAFGVVPREVNCEEDIPEVSQDCDNLSLHGLDLLASFFNNLADKMDKSLFTEYDIDKMSVVL